MSLEASLHQRLVDGTQVWLHYLFLWELITFQDWWLQVFFTSPTKLNQVHWKAKQDGVDYIRNAVIIGFMANELISIVENAGLMGLPLPDAINKAIDVLTEQKEG